MDCTVYFMTKVSHIYLFCEKFSVMKFTATSTGTERTKPTATGQALCGDWNRSIQDRQQSFTGV